MKKMNLERIQEILSDMGYKINEDGKLVIELSTNDLTAEEWEKVFYCTDPNSNSRRKELYLVPALNRLLKEKEKDYPYQLASHIFYDVLNEEEIREYTYKIIPEIESFIRKSSVICCSIDSFMKKEVKVNIGVDTGDSGWDYTANTVPPAYGAEYSLSEAYCASIIWLTKQQGHKKSELHHALNHIEHEPELVKNPLMFSIANEVWHELSIFNQLYFLVKMTVEDMLRLNTLIQWHKSTKKWGGYIIINKEATAGFYDSGEGSTSLLGIHLENDIKLPVKFMSSAFPEEAFSYSIYSITENPCLWDNGKILYWSMPKHFRLSMERFGLHPVRKNVKPQTAG